MVTVKLVFVGRLVKMGGDSVLLSVRRYAVQIAHR